MQLFLASILSCAAVLVGVLAQTDWKPYSLPEAGVASLSNEALLFTGIDYAFDGNPNESLARLTDYDRGAENAFTEKIINRTRDASIRRRETKLMTESAGLLARNKGPAFAFTDSSGRAINFDFDFSEHSFEMLAKGGSKEKLAKAKKFFSAVSAMAEREIRKELVRSERQQRAERREAKRELSDELIRIERVDRAEPVEAACPQSGEPTIRIDRSVRSNQ